MDMTKTEILRKALQNRPWAERAHVKNGAVEVFGVLPSTGQDGWVFVAWLDDVYVKGVEVLR